MIQKSLSLTAKNYPSGQVLKYSRIKILQMKSSIPNDISILNYIMAHTKNYINVQTLARNADIHGDVSILVKRS